MNSCIKKINKWPKNIAKIWYVRTYLIWKLNLNTFVSFVDSAFVWKFYYSPLIVSQNQKTLIFTKWVLKKAKFCFASELYFTEFKAFVDMIQKKTTFLYVCQKTLYFPQQLNFFVKRIKLPDKFSCGP